MINLNRFNKAKPLRSMILLVFIVVLSNTTGGLVASLMGYYFYFDMPKETGSIATYEKFHLHSAEYQVFSQIIIIPLAILVLYGYFKPIIKKSIEWKNNNDFQQDETLILSRRRLINTPIFFLFFSIVIWMIMLVGHLAYMLILMDLGNDIILVIVLDYLQGAIASGVLVFFISELYLRKYLISVFFKEGHLLNIPKTFKLSINKRLTALYLTVVITSALTLFALVYIKNHMALKYGQIEVIENTQFALMIYLILYCILSYILFRLVSQGYTTQLKQMENVVNSIHSGALIQSVDVNSNDEIGRLGDGINDMITGLKERDFIKDTFGKYVSVEIRDTLLKSDITLGGEEKYGVVLFSDIRNFTHFSEKHSPTEVVLRINEYFSAMVEAISSERGVIDKFIGDAIMAVFGLPIEQKDPEIAAMNAAIKMQHKLEELNTQWQLENKEPLQHGIGIHAGYLLAGNIGSADRLEYTCIGDTVNIASRLESLTKEYKSSILLSQSIKNKVDSLSLNLIPIGNIQVKGKDQSIECFTIKEFTQL